MDWEKKVPHNSFADTMAMLALSEGSGWIECAQGLIQNVGYAPSNVISCREDVYLDLKAHDFTDKDAFRGMNCVRKGRGFPVVTKEMRTAPDHWFLRQCEGIAWLPSKGHLLSRLFFHLKTCFLPCRVAKQEKAGKIK